jgi:uncharacterized protein involved in exopolysaccharide biosynthesis
MSRRVALFAPPPAADSIMGGWCEVLRRRWRAGAGLFVAVAGLAVAVVLLARPVWRAEESLRLGAPAPVGGVSLGGGSSPAGLFTLFQQMTGDPFANELELLSSRTVVEGVVEDNALNVTVVAPRGWYRDSLLTALAADRSTGKAVFEARWLPGGGVRVRRTAPTDSLVGDFAAGRAARFGGLTVAFMARRAGMPETVELRTIPFGEAVRRTTGRLKAERKRREANLVRISYDDPDPGLALAVVRSAGGRYTALRSGLSRRESGETIDSLRAVADQTLRELRRAEAGLAAFQREARLVDPGAQGEALIKRYDAVSGSLAGAQLDLSRTEEILRRVDGVADPGTAWAGLIADPAFVENATLGDLLGTLVKLQQKRIELVSRRTPEDRQVQALDGQIRYLDGSLRALLREHRDGVASTVAMLRTQQAAMDGELARAPGNVVELGRRQRAVRQLSEVYLFTDQRLRQESLRDAVSFSTVQVVDPPAVLFKPVWPRRKLGVGVGMILAMVFGALGMALAERADRSVRGAGEVRELTGAPVLAALTPGRDGGLHLTPGERRALAGIGITGERLLLAPVGGSAQAEALARALEAAPALAWSATGRWEDALPAAVARPQTVEVGPEPSDYAAAAELAVGAEAGGEIVLVIRHGTTSRDALRRAAGLLREAGAGAAGVVVIAGDERERDAVWR